ncbi:ABC transporter ATP-binding protein [Oceanivirga salmonicida]|uniref:ABC transporter ATP-binding protein n=1 Tax=Oceanivirga salmonicida TaxID=1769291 RepID=UPI0012E1E144|nr:ABC transporter ATP-binding protein [Oceanivirga salmonicida]
MNKKVAIEFENVGKTYTANKNEAIKNINFKIYEGEFVTILGSSGCGKTTILKMINKLIMASSGNVYVQNENVNDKDTLELRRSIGYVIQEIGLFPHLNIFENISILLNVLKKDKLEIENRVKELMELIDLDYDKYSKLYPNQLSGGQKQRVGVARALASNPNIMLLDEPFGALDAITRIYLQKEIKKIHKELSHKTFVLITHDISEALLLGSRVLIMNNGKIEQFDTPQNILKNPKTDFVKDLLNAVRDQFDVWREYQ